MRRNLTKKEKLRTRREIDRVFRSGKTVACKGMRLGLIANGFEYCRFVVVAARGHRNAVERNRTKRFGREVYRAARENLPTGFDFAVVCYPGDYDYADRTEQFLHLLMQARIKKLFSARRDLNTASHTIHN